VLKVIRVLRELQGTQEHKVIQEPKVIQVHKVLQVTQEHRVRLEPKGR
jgi:hypothetical protein